MKTATKTTTIELFDFAKSIGVDEHGNKIEAFISFSGSFAPHNTFANANLMLPHYGTARLDGWSVFGRSEKGDVEEALANLAKNISEQTIHFDTIGSNYTKREVPKLKHTKGYRG